MAGIVRLGGRWSLESYLNRTVALAFFFLLLVISNKVFCASCDEFQSALYFIGDLRRCSALCEWFGTELPVLHKYVPTSNKVVNCIMEEEYIHFWQNLRKGDYRPLMKRLVEESMGTDLQLYDRMGNNSRTRKRRGIDEANILKPLLLKVLPQAYLKCIVSKNEEDVLDCLKRNVERNICEGLEREMILSSIWLLDISTQIEECGGYVVSQRELSFLRSDESALACVCDWDRIATIPKILFLTFFLQAHQLIAYLTKDAEEADNVARLQMELKKKVSTEFPLRMMMEIIRANVIGSLLYKKEKQNVRRPISEVRLVLVKQQLKVEHAPKLFQKNQTLYISVPEFYHEKDDSLERLFDRVVQEMSNGSLIMNCNPMPYLVK